MRMILRQVNFVVVSLILWPQYNANKSANDKEELEYEIILRFSGKRLQRYDNSKMKYQTIEPFTDRFFVPYDNTVIKKVEDMLTKAETAIENDNLNKQSFSLYIITTDEFRSLKIYNPEYYDSFNNSLYEKIDLTNNLKNRTHIYYTNSVDHGWAYYKMAMEKSMIQANEILIAINRFEIFLCFEVSDDRLEQFSFGVSQYAKDIGMNKFFSKIFDCSGPEYIEILLNNYIIKMTSNENIHSNPCYPSLYSENYIRNLKTHFEACDPLFYTNTSLKEWYQIIGDFDENRCYKLLDEFIQNHELCKDKIDCRILDPIFYDLIPSSGKYVISMGKHILLPKYLNQLMSPDGYKDLVKNFCRPFESNENRRLQRHETCFYILYINYIFEKTKIRSKDHKLDVNTEIPWSAFFRTRYLEEKIVASELNLGLIIGIVLFLLLLLILVVVLTTYFILNKKKKEKYDLREAKS